VAREARTSIAQGTGEDPDLLVKREIFQGEFALRPKG